MTAEDAAYYGNLEILQWLKENNFAFSSRARSHMKSSNNPEIIEWIKQNNKYLKI
jgi:hypothetical protein